MKASAEQGTLKLSIALTVFLGSLVSQADS